MCFIYVAVPVYAVGDHDAGIYVHSADHTLAGVKVIYYGAASADLDGHAYDVHHFAVLCNGFRAGSDGNDP